MKAAAATLCLGIAALAGCGRGSGEPPAGSALRQTELPGQVTAGGATSGTVIASAARTASAPAKDMAAASREAGTPGIPEGSGGNTSGARLGGSTGSSALANTGEQTAAQRTPGEGAPAHAADAPRAAAAASAPASAPAALSAASAAAEQKRLLDERIVQVARRWQQRASAPR